MVSKFKTKIEMAAEIMEVLKERFHVARVMFDPWYWSEKLVRGSVVSELKSNRRLLRVRSLEGERTLGVEGHPHVGVAVYVFLLRLNNFFIPPDA